jgi:hypothetical protein
VVRVTWVKEKEMEEDENASSQKKLSSPQLNSTQLFYLLLGLEIQIQQQ